MPLELRSWCCSPEARTAGTHLTHTIWIEPDVATFWYFLPMPKHSSTIQLYATHSLKCQLWFSPSSFSIKGSLENVCYLKRRLVEPWNAHFAATYWYLVQQPPPAQKFLWDAKPLRMKRSLVPRRRMKPQKHWQKISSLLVTQMQSAAQQTKCLLTKNGRIWRPHAWKNNWGDLEVSWSSSNCLSKHEQIVLQGTCQPINQGTMTLP